MKKASFLTRCLAMALALVLIATSANLGVALKAFAADTVTVSNGQIIANNYDLTAAEKDLLSSGYLAGGSFEYTVPTAGDNLVSVDTDNALITAKSLNGWVPTTALIKHHGEEKLTVTFVDGKASYDAATVGNAFSVTVNYSLDTQIAAADQEAMLGAAELLKSGLNTAQTVAGQEDNLSALEKAMPELVKLANTGVQTSFANVELSDACKAAIATLNQQVTDNGGKLDLSVSIAAYKSGSKMGYIMTNGKTMQADVAELVKNTTEIATALNTIYNNIGWLIDGGYVSQETANQIQMLASICSKLNTALSAVNTEEAWVCANTTGLLSDSVNYAKLDEKVEALGTLTSVTVKETLHVADTSIQVNLSMYNVTVKVVLNVVGTDNEIVEYGSKTAVVTLGEGAAKSEILSEIAATGVEAAAIAEWGTTYIAEQYEATATALPETLTADTEYTITYAPKQYNVTLWDETSAEHPYGYMLNLPVHEDPTQAYDYMVNGTYYAQGLDIMITEDTTITRTYGKAYVVGTLMTIIADNYGNEKLDAILTSGAVKGDEIINYREPTLAELETLVQLSGNTLTVQPYASAYQGLQWEPYTYVVDGVEHKFNGKTEVTIEGDFEMVSVYYRLTLTNYPSDEVKAIMDQAIALEQEAKGQKSVLDSLAAPDIVNNMGQLNNSMLGALNAVIGANLSTEPGGGGLHEDPVENDKLVAFFQGILGEIKTNCVDVSDGYLKLYNIIKAYNDPNNGGLLYYYQNDEYVIAQLSLLTGYLNEMLATPERVDALAKLMVQANPAYGEYVEKLDSLSTKLTQIEKDLKPVNSAIDTTNPAKLSALVAALTMEGTASYTDCGSPYVEMGPVNRTAEKYVTVEVKAVIGNSSTIVSVTKLKGEALTQDDVAALKKDVNDFVNGKIDTYFYSNNYNNGSELDALVGVELTEGKLYTYEWTANSYTVKISGEKDQTISINSLTVTLPAHPQAANGMSYEYQIGDEVVSSGVYTFKAEQVKTLFKNGAYTIARTEKDAAVEKLVAMVNTVNEEMGFTALTLVEENGLYTGIVANIGANDMMNLVMGLVKSGYNYIGLNNEGLMYENEKAELEISLQTLINAVLNDENFSSDLLIALGNDGKGTLLTTSMQLGNSATDLQYADLTFQINLTSVPSQMATLGNYLNTASGYITFKAVDGKMVLDVNLPDKVYGAYAAALIATGNVDKTDVNALDQAVAMQFLLDYITAITGSEMDMQTFNNTLSMMGVSRDLTSYNTYYNQAVNAYNKYSVVTVNEAGTNVDISVPGNTSIDGLINFMGIDKSSVSSYLGMIKEYKQGGTIDVSATATLKNTDKTYYALVVDAQAAGAANKFDAPSNTQKLAEKTAALAGYSAVILLDDVNCNLYFAGTTILDLNGKTISGNVSGDNLFIVDSSMDTYKSGWITGSVSGTTVTILGGNYNADVSAYLKDGYYKDGDTVRNALYYIEDVDGTMTFYLNGDVYSDEHVNGYIPNAQALAIDIAGDLLLNFASTAKLSVEGHELVAIDVDDLVGIYASDATATNLVDALMGCVTIGEAGYENNKGLEAVVNMIIEDVLDFGAINTALTGGTAVATYGIITEPWQIEIAHVEDGDYATINVTHNPALSKERKVALVIESKHNDKLIALTGELDKIVVADETSVMVDIPQPTYSNKQFGINANADATVVVDMSQNPDYAIVVGVILAYNGASNEAEIVAAINSGNTAALAKAINNSTVQELISALKAMARNVDFATMASKAGITADLTSAAELEAVYHLMLCGAGKAFEQAGINGMNVKLSQYLLDGYYTLDKESITRDVNVSAGGYSALITLTADEVVLKIKLFGEIEEEDPCLWGDADHDGDVDNHDASLVFEYFMADDAEKPEICLIRTDVDGDGEITNHDASLIFECFMSEDPEYVFPAEKLN